MLFGMLFARAFRLGGAIANNEKDGAAVTSLRAPSPCSAQVPESSELSAGESDERKTDYALSLIQSDRSTELERSEEYSEQDGDREKHHSKRLRYRSPLPCSGVHAEPTPLFLSPSPFSNHEPKLPLTYTAKKDNRKIRDESPEPVVLPNQFRGNYVIFNGESASGRSQPSLPELPTTTSSSGWTPVSARKVAFPLSHTHRENRATRSARDSVGPGYENEVDVYEAELDLKIYKRTPLRLAQHIADEEFDYNTMIGGKKLTASNLEFYNNVAPLLFSHYTGITLPPPHKTYKYLDGSYNPDHRALLAACDALEAKMRVLPMSVTPDSPSDASSHTLCLGDGEGGSTWEGCNDSDDGRNWSFNAVWGDGDEVDEGDYIRAVKEGEEILRVQSPSPSFGKVWRV
jgi:hypothetical protein